MMSSILNATIPADVAKAKPARVAHRMRAIAKTTVQVVSALREGLAAMRRYETLRASGSSHASAVTRLFGAGH